MAITIKNNTNLLNQLKTAVENLPTKDEVTLDLSPTDAGSLDVLSPKRVYLVDANGTPTMVKGTMPNLGDSLNVKVGIDGTGETVKTGYVTKVTGSFSDEVYSEISEQSYYIARIGKKLIEKYKLDYYTVEFRKPDGTILQVNFVKYGTSVEYTGKDLTYYDEDGYKFEFIGWDKDTTNVTSDMVVTAKFKSNKPTIIKMNLTNSNYLQPTLGTPYLTGESTIDWGDGTIDKSSEMFVTKSTPYATTGEYTIKHTFVGNKTPGSTGKTSLYFASAIETYRRSVTECSFQEGVYEQIYGSCFNDSKLTEVKIPEGIIEIGSSAYQGIETLQNATIVLPSTLTRIGQQVFTQFNNNISTIIMKSPIVVTPTASSTAIVVNKYYNNVFWIPLLVPVELLDQYKTHEHWSRYTLLMGYEYENDSIIITVKEANGANLTPNAFVDLNIKEIRVPMSSVDAYKTKTNWSTFASKIVGY